LLVFLICSPIFFVEVVPKDELVGELRTLTA